MCKLVMHGRVWMACVCGGEYFNKVVCFLQERMTPYLHLPVSQSVVLELTKGLQNRGHHLFCDNYYTGVPLFSSLRELGFGACGTLRVNRRGRGSHCTDQGRHPRTEVDGETTSYHPSQ